MGKAFAIPLLLSLLGCAAPAPNPGMSDAAQPRPGAEGGTDAIPAPVSEAAVTPTAIAATDPDRAPTPAAGDQASDATDDHPATDPSIGGDLFPTRVVGEDAIVTIQRPRLISASSDSLMMSAEIEVYVDAAGESFSGTALLPSSLIQDAPASPLIQVRRKDIRFVFSEDIAARHDQILAAAGFAFSRQPELLHFADVRDADTIRLTASSPGHRLSVGERNLALPLARARQREAIRRATVQREYERLMTTPRGEPPGPTPYQRYQQRIYRYSPVLTPRRGLSRGGLNRGGIGRR